MRIFYAVRRLVKNLCGFANYFNPVPKIRGPQFRDNHKPCFEIFKLEIINLTHFSIYYFLDFKRLNNTTHSGPKF